MKEENEINEEVKELLDSLEQHGRNTRRQKELSDLIDGLDRKSEINQRKTLISHLSPLIWLMGAAAAILLLWLLVKPVAKEIPDMNEKILVEETKTVDSVNIKEDNIVFEEPSIMEELVAEETPINPEKPQNHPTEPSENVIEILVEESLLAENTPTEPTIAEITDTVNIGSNITPNVTEENLSPLTSHLSPSQSPKRRVVQSLNLVCYECQKEPDYTPNSSLLTSHSEKTIFGQPQDPNMKNGSLAFELKLQ